MNIPKFYAGKSIFITGATGFIGKVLLEKILRCLPGVTKVYVLIRPKRGETPRERLISVLQAPLFDKLSVCRPDFERCIKPVAGDMSLPHFNMSENDFKDVTENVSIVFHCAASVQFHSPLRDAINSNLRSVNYMLSLIDEMKKFEVFVHLSTAYAFCYRQHIGEVIYPTKISPNSILNWSEWMTSEMVEKIAEDLQGDHPNSYTYTKSLAENLISQRSRGQTVIVRPSIVTSAWKEPIPGWCDSVNGPVGMIIPFAKGLVRVMLGKRDFVANFVPVDVAANMMIAGAWRAATTKKSPSNITIYNCTNNDDENRTFWGKFADAITENAKTLPLDDPFMAPAYGRYFTPSSFNYKMQWIFLHWIPAYITDFGFSALGKKSKLVPWYQKARSLCDAVSYFTMRAWTWDNSNVKELASRMTDEDRKVFYIDASELNWERHFADYYAGVKSFVLKDNPDNLTKTKNKIKFYEYMSVFIEILIIVMVWSVIALGNWMSEENRMRTIFFVFLCRVLIFLYSRFSISARTGVL